MTSRYKHQIFCIYYTKNYVIYESWKKQLHPIGTRCWQQYMLENRNVLISSTVKYFNATQHVSIICIMSLFVLDCLYSICIIYLY